ncbi:MAG: PAS domain S-box protein, partial [Patescibacteria group bacterium]
MGLDKPTLKTFLRFLRNGEMRSLYIVLAIIAAVFIFVSFQYSFSFSVLLVILFSFIVGQLIGTFMKLARLSSEEKFKTKERDVIIAFLEDGVIMYDLNFRVLTFNAAAETIFGLSSAEVLEKQFDPGIAKTPHYRVFVQTLFPSLAPSMIQVSETDRWPQVVELSFENPRLELLITLHQIKDEAGRLTGFIKLVHDMTREKGLLQSKTDFISVAAHQLRTPLTALHWAIESIVKFSENNPDIKSLAEEALA